MDMERTSRALPAAVRPVRSPAASRRMRSSCSSFQAEADPSAIRRATSKRSLSSLLLLRRSSCLWSWIVGNNGMWGLEKHPMRSIYGWDMACDLQPGCRYDDVVRALGGAGETVTRASEVGPALDRAFASGVPYLVNVLTDPDDVYPRSSNLG